jgi:hypothetical protein
MSLGPLVARPWRAGGDGRPVSIPALPWKEREKMQEAEEAEANRYEVTVELSEAHDTASHVDRYYFSCSCGACGPLRRIRDIARQDGGIHEIWHEQNR